MNSMESKQKDWVDTASDLPEYTRLVYINVGGEVMGEFLLECKDINTIRFVNYHNDNICYDYRRVSEWAYQD